MLGHELIAARPGVIWLGSALLGTALRGSALLGMRRRWQPDGRYCCECQNPLVHSPSNRWPARLPRQNPPADAHTFPPVAEPCGAQRLCRRHVHLSGAANTRLTLL